MPKFFTHIGYFVGFCADKVIVEYPIRGCYAASEFIVNKSVEVYSRFHTKEKDNDLEEDARS